MDDQAPRSFLDELHLDPTGDDAFRAVLSGFGGTTLGVAGHALGRSCPGLALSAFQATFLRAVAEDEPVDVRVTRVRDGRLLAHRRVEIARAGKVVFEAAATFTSGGEGIGFQQIASPRDVPQPEALPEDRQVARRAGMEFWPGPVEFRWIGSPEPLPGPEEGSRWSVWVKPRLPLPDDPALRAGALCFLADIHCDYAVRRRLGPTFTRDRFITLEQSLWLHADRPWNDWWLMTSDTDTAHGGRALNWRWLFDRQGRHLATLAQHSLLRGEGQAR